MFLAFQLDGWRGDGVEMEMEMEMGIGMGIGMRGTAVVAGGVEECKGAVAGTEEGASSTSLRLRSGAWITFSDRIESGGRSVI